MIEATTCNMSADKKVLVCFGDRKRTISIPVGVDISDEESLRNNAYEVFQDLLSPSIPIVFQLKDEEWGGEFVDLLSGQAIEDKSIVKMIITKTTKKVRFVEQCACAIIHYMKIGERAYLSE